MWFKVTRQLGRGWHVSHPVPAFLSTETHPDSVFSVGSTLRRLLCLRGGREGQAPSWEHLLAKGRPPSGGVGRLRGPCGCSLWKQIFPVSLIGRVRPSHRFAWFLIFRFGAMVATDALFVQRVWFNVVWQGHVHGPAFPRRNWVWSCVRNTEGLGTEIRKDQFSREYASRKGVKNIFSFAVVGLFCS